MEPESGSKGKRKILLVDDHPIVCAGFSELLNREPDFIVCANAANSGEAVQAVEKYKPDMAIIDISLEGSNGIELLKLMRSLHPHLPIMILSMHSESIYAQRALRAGAKGYLMKHTPTEEVIHAIRAILRGEMHFSSRMNDVIVQKAFGHGAAAQTSPLDQLTDRELEIFTLLGQGLKTAVIAKKLHLSIKTVESHRAHIKDKLGLKNSLDLFACAVRWNSRGDSEELETGQELKS